jgi:hypothetical protein
MGAQTAWIKSIGGCLVFGPNKQGSGAAFAAGAGRYENHQGE